MRTTITRALLGAGLALGLPACGDKDEDTGGELLPAGGDDGGDADCEGNAPVVVSVDCVNAGIAPEPETGADLPTMDLLIDLDDEDGDLHSYQMNLYLDEDEDGSVSTASSPFGTLSQSLPVDECQGFGAEIRLTLYLSGGEPAYDTWYEWGLEVTDANGYDSELFIFACGTPKADGTDGPDGEG